MRKVPLWLQIKTIQMDYRTDEFLPLKINYITTEGLHVESTATRHG